MSLLIFILIVLVVLALVLYGISLLPMLDGTVLRIVQAVAVFVAAIVILNRSGIV